MRDTISTKITNGLDSPVSWLYSLGSPDEISEETIVPCVVSNDKGAFITKMDSGGNVEFVEKLCSPDFEGPGRLN